MDLSIAFVFASVINAGLFAWYFEEKRREKRKPQEPPISPTEIQLLKTALQMERTERHRVANSLHLKSSSTIAAVKMYLNALQAVESETKAEENYKNVHALLDSAYVEINKSLYSLMPEVTLENGLDETLRKYCSHLSTHNLLSIAYDSWGVARRYHEAFELSVFRFVQMLINHILQHNKATIAVVQMGMGSNTLTIAVEDNGAAYKPVQELLEEPFFIHLKKSIRAVNGQVEIRIDNGLCAFIQFDTVAFGRDETALMAS
jgi:two-component system, NarL family, sensor kinase